VKLQGPNCSDATCLKHSFTSLSPLELLSLIIIDLFSCRTPVIMAEQDTYASHFPGIDPSKASAAIKAYDLHHSTGSEQERYAAHFSLKKPDASVDTTWPAPAVPIEVEQEVINAHFYLRPRNTVDATAVGILRSTLLPSFGLHSGLSIIAYVGGRLTDRVEAKDWLWPTSQVINAWWSSVGTRVLCDNLDISTAWSTLEYPEKLLLGAVTLWGERLFYRIASRSISRGSDDPRYEAKKTESGFWDNAFFSIFLPEAAFQTLISLPFTLPFRATHASLAASPVPACAELVHGLAVFLFSSGFALEVLADKQLCDHQKKSNTLNTQGVWSIVRHPK
jgi:steroid 5-alpha reductase family enzyme